METGFHQGIKTDITKIVSFMEGLIINLRKS